MVTFQFEKILKENNARKIFGKQEISIIMKQINGIQLTQSEKNRLSRDIRPKFEFIKKISKFEKEFELKKNANNWKIINKTVETILNDKLAKDIKAVLLFGSIVEGCMTKKSDIDLCIVFDKISFKEASLFKIRILGEINEKVDISVFNNLPEKIKKSIAKNHKVLYKANGFDNIEFTINHIKNDFYFKRMEKIFGETA
jgi:predicted nucleotidyltransferase